MLIFKCRILGLFLLVMSFFFLVTGCSQEVNNEVINLNVKINELNNEVISYLDALETKTNEIVELEENLKMKNEKILELEAIIAENDKDEKEINKDRPAIDGVSHFDEKGNSGLYTEGLVFIDEAVLKIDDVEKLELIKQLKVLEQRENIINKMNRRIENKHIVTTDVELIYQSIDEGELRLKDVKLLTSRCKLFDKIYCGMDEKQLIAMVHWNKYEKKVYKDDVFKVYQLSLNDSVVTIEIKDEKVEHINLRSLTYLQ